MNIRKVSYFLASSIALLVLGLYLHGNLGPESPEKQRAVNFLKTYKRLPKYSDIGVDREAFGESGSTYWVDFRNEDFTGANLAGADMSGGLFQGANFTDADLTGADVTNADFKDAKFIRAKIQRLKNSRTNFDGANFTGADARYETSPDFRPIMRD